MSFFFLFMKEAFFILSPNICSLIRFLLLFNIYSTELIEFKNENKTKKDQQK